MIENNDLDRLYVVYKHTCKITKKVYVGITCQKPEKRWKKDGKGYVDCKIFYNAIEKYGWKNFEHEILYIELTHDEACEKEIELISYYKSLGISYNITDGGEGTLGFKWSEEEKKAISLRMKGENNPMYGKHLTEEQKKTISLRMSGKNNPMYGKHHAEEEKKAMSLRMSGKNNPTYGRHHTEEEKKAMSLKMRGENNPNYGKRGKDNPCSKKVVQMDLDGNIIKIWDSAATVKRELKINSSHISQCCKGKGRKTAGGYKWKYYEESYSTTIV